MGDERGGGAIIGQHNVLLKIFNQSIKGLLFLPGPQSEWCAFKVPDMTSVPETSSRKSYSTETGLAHKLLGK